MDRFSGAPARPITLNKYLYAGADPVNKTDPSGLTADIGEEAEVSAVAGIEAATPLPNIGIAVNRVAGKAFEDVVEKKLAEFTAQYGGKVFKQVFVKGPGGRRFVDFVVQMGDRLIAIEAKTKIPYGGGALVRLAGQLKTFLNPTAVGSLANPVSGEIVQVIVVTEEELAASQMAFARIATQLETGSMGPVISGTVNLIGLLSQMFGL